MGGVKTKLRAKTADSGVLASYKNDFYYTEKDFIK
jgi:hypothetical protein